MKKIKISLDLKFIRRKNFKNMNDNEKEEILKSMSEQEREK